MRFNPSRIFLAAFVAITFALTNVASAQYTQTVLLNFTDPGGANPSTSRAPRGK